MSGVVTLFQIVLPALLLFALVAGIAMGVVRLIRLLPAQRPRIVSTHPKRDLTRRR
jgi:hypothetical protein